MGKGILVTPTIYGNLLLGPDAIDEESGRDRSTHVERLAAIYHQGLLTTPDIEINRFLRSFTGVRAVSSTDDFIIEMSQTSGLVHVAGIQSPGVTSAPAIADQVAGLLEASGLAMNVDPDYVAERPPLAVDEDRPRVSMVEAARLAQLPDGPTRLVCRCEQVAVQAILDSLERGITVRTLDGIKRRTRASMGFCQGQFCRPRLLALLAKRGYSLMDSLTDAERDGSVRVTKKELLQYLNERGRQRDS
jgi:glycerol-3-phosphate dehydrogenase